MTRGSNSEDAYLPSCSYSALPGQGSPHLQAMLAALPALCIPVYSNNK